MVKLCSKIVVPYDDSSLSKKALETAIILAQHDEKIELNVISVINVNIPITFYVALDVNEGIEAQRLKAKDTLEKVEEHLKAIPNQSATFVLDGNPAETIVKFVKQNGADLVVMGSRGLSSMKEMFLGSVSHYVVQKSPCPVFIVK